MTPSQRRGAPFAPIHWTDATAGRARIGTLTHATVDPVSGQPGSKATPATIAPSFVAAQGFLVSRRRVALPEWLAHARIAVRGGEALTFASAERPAALHAFLSNWLGRAATPIRRVDESAERFHSASFADGRLEMLLHVAPKFDRAALETAIGEGATSVEAVGRATRAGTNCGSCRAEIRQLVMRRDLVAATAAEEGERHVRQDGRQRDRRRRLRRRRLYRRQPDGGAQSPRRSARRMSVTQPSATPSYNCSAIGPRGHWGAQNRHRGEP